MPKKSQRKAERTVRINQDFDMQDETVFLPDHRGASIQHMALISGGFFIIVQLFFLDSLQIRLAFTVAFSVFLLLGFWFSKRNSRRWPQKIVINRSGICCGSMKAQYGVNSVPWSDVARMDLYYSDVLLPPWLRIALRPGAFREQVKKSRLQRLSMGLDVNIPVSVQVAPEVVLETAQKFWKEAESIRT